MSKILPIGIVAEMLGVTLQTLRRWDSQGILKSNRSGALTHRHYTEDQIEDFLSYNYKYLMEAGRKWAFSDEPTVLPSRFYCLDKSIFKARLSKLESLLAKDSILEKDFKFSLIILVVGEIGNNSFDHNLGNWPDARGVFFGYNLDERKIILADRGQGILTTLKRVKKELSSDKKALETAFTEYISGRSPERRGNGLKTVKDVVEGKYPKEKEKLKTLVLLFQSGDAETTIKFGDKKLIIKNNKNFNRGCFAEIYY